MTDLTFHTLLDLAGGRFGATDVACPLCGPGRNAPENRKRRVLRIWIADDFATYNCARCGAHGYAHARGELGVIAPRPILPQQDDDKQRRIALALKLWSASVPIAGTLACTYLARERGLDIAALPDLRHVVRWHEGFNAIISLMTDPISGEPHGIHRTYLNFDGTKRDRKMLGRVGVIRVVDGHQRWLGVSEGLEDALSVIQLGWTQRIWAATSAGAIERLPIMDGIERLAIFADADQEGKRAAHRLEDRYRFRRGAHVAIHLPPAPHKDWNDMLRARRRAAA